MGADYDTSADLWSFACMIFELITADFLFEPRKSQSYGKSDDHLAQMIELLGPMPKSFALAGKNLDKYFSHEKEFLNIQGLKHFPLKNLLMDKYHLKPIEAE